jgi:hypothetical protein
MSRLEEEVTDLLANAQKPIFVNPDLFAALANAKVHRERRRRLGALASVIAIVTAGVTAFVLANRNTSSPASRGPSSTAIPTQAAGGASIPGVPFPACHTTTLVYYSESPEYGPISMFARGTTKLCPDMAVGNAYLGFNVGRTSPGPKPIVFGPIECFQGCRIFGAPDIDGDGKPELSVVVTDGEGFDRIELYRIRPKAATPFAAITTSLVGQETPVSFDWFDTGDSRAGATCSKTENDVLDIWSATKQGGDWHVVQEFLRIRGTRVVSHWTGRYTTGLAAGLPAGGGSEFCGAAVSP